MRRVYTCSMANVYLPFGYPLVQGEAFQTVIYQGGAARLYDIPADPRTDSQLFNRKFLSDTSKVRSTLGVFGKGAGRAALGPKWGGVLYQLIKADDASRWSDAVAAWDAAGSDHKQEWRDAAPYVATFNDPGKMFFCVARALAKAIVDYTGFAYESQVWEEDQASDAVAWWTRDFYYVLKKGDWSSWSGYLFPSEGGDSVYFVGKEITFNYGAGGTSGSVDVYRDGKYFVSQSFSSGGGYSDIPFEWMGLHRLHYVNWGYFNLVTAIHIQNHT